MVALAGEPLASHHALALTREPVMPARSPYASLGPPSALALRPSPEDVTSLKRRLEGEAEQRDAARASLRRFGRTLDLYRKRLRSLADDSAVGGDFSVGADLSNAGLGVAQRARETVRSLEADVLRGGRSDAELASMSFAGEAGAEAGALAVSRSTLPPPARSSQVLRQSLEEAQRRCKTLGSGMVQQTQTNEELVEALGAVKDANKRLLEQIRFQTDEIAQLTQQRISDEERIDHITNKHHADKESYSSELLRGLADVRECEAAKHRSLQVRLTDKLRTLRTRLEIMGQDAARTMDQQRQLRREATTLAESFQVQVQAALGDVAQRCGSYSEEHAKQRRAIEESILELEGKLSSEREDFQGEGLAWSHKHSALVADAEDGRARMARDIAQLSSQLQALERLLGAERQAWAEESSSLRERIAESSSRQALRSEELEQQQRKLSRLEAAVLGAEAEAKAKDQVLEDLRRQRREGEDALAAAAGGNERLRRQLEEQRKRFGEKNEADLADAQSSLERQLLDASQAQAADAAVTSRRQRALEDRLLEEEEELRAAKAQLLSLEEGCDALQSDTEAQRSQHDAAKAARQGLEKELADARQNAALERLRLQAEGERLTQSAAAAGEDVQRMEEHMGEFRRAAGAREADHCARHAASEAALGDLQRQLAELKRRLLEASEARLRADEEVASAKRRGLEAQAALERRLGEAGREAQEMRRRLGDALVEGERGVEQARKDFELERESGLAMLRRAQDESRSKLGMVETNKARLEEHCRAESSEASEMVAQQQRRCDTLERELTGLRKQLSESEANLAWVREEFDRDDRESSFALRQMQEDTRSVKAALEKAVREEASLSRQIEEATQRQGQEQRRLTKEMQSVRAAAAKEAVDFEGRLRRESQALELRGPSPHRIAGGSTSVSAERSREEVLLEQDNSRLRSMLSEQGRGSAGLNALHSKLESHIQRLQRHTEELRSSLHGGGGPVSAATTTVPGRHRHSTGGIGTDFRPMEPLVQMREADDGPSTLGQSILSGGG